MSSDDDVNCMRLYLETRLNWHKSLSEKLIDIIRSTPTMVMAGGACLSAKYCNDWVSNDIDIFVRFGSNTQNESVLSQFGKTVDLTNSSLYRKFGIVRHYNCELHVDEHIAPNIDLIFVRPSSFEHINRFDFSFCKVYFDGYKFGLLADEKYMTRRYCVDYVDMESAACKKYKERGFSFCYNSEPPELPLKKAKTDNNESKIWECPVCVRSAFEKGVVPIVLDGCNEVAHTICLDCFKLSIKEECPFCRAKVISTRPIVALIDTNDKEAEEKLQNFYPKHNDACKQKREIITSIDQFIRQEKKYREIYVEKHTDLLVLETLNNIKQCIILHFSNGKYCHTKDLTFNMEHNLCILRNDQEKAMFYKKLWTAWNSETLGLKICKNEEKLQIYSKK